MDLQIENVKENVKRLEAPHHYTSTNKEHEGTRSTEHIHKGQKVAK